MFKIFGSKKKDFFLEIDDATETPKADTPVALVEAVKTEAAKVEKAVKTEAAKVEKAVKTEAAKVEKAVKSEAAKVEKAVKSSKKDKSKAAEAPKAEAPAAPPVPALPAKPKAPEPVVLFAPDNLMPLPNPTRRRPGPNMAAFLSMAKQVKRR